MIGPLAQTGLVWNMEAQIGRSRIKTQRESIFSSLLCLSFKKVHLLSLFENFAIFYFEMYQYFLKLSWVFKAWKLTFKQVKLL